MATRRQRNPRWKIIIEFNHEALGRWNFDDLLGKKTVAGGTELVSGTRDVTYEFPGKEEALAAKRKLKLKFRAKIHVEVLPV